MKTAVIRRISAFIILVIFFFPAKAQIVYTDINPDTTISYGKEYDLDLNNDGITDFMFYSNLVGSQAPCYIVNFGITALNADSIILRGFNLNERIGDTTLWNHATTLNNIKSCRCGRNPESGGYTVSCVSYFGNNNDIYIPLKIVVNNLAYYGWVRFLESSNGSSLTIKDYAYNSAPNEPILAGEGAEGGPLPLTFINFKGVIKNNEAVLNWTTANEINNQGFYVERSGDGKKFIAIGFIKSRGNTAAATDYDFTDSAVQAGNNYYRLKQTDYGGNFKYSSIIKIKYTTGQDNTIKITPNPFSNLTTISFSIPQSQKISIQVYDMEGRLVKTVANNEMPAGVHQITWNATNGNGSAVANGLYILILKTGEDTETKKVSVIR